ncbi:MAG TPA: SDR family oxidoreductase [Ktedonobacteraceae bacterium]|nr:SDR family oxidoreductase [Ktedonobacteraceae bacterium]
MNSTNMPDTQNQIAVIGMACRLPGANDADEFWQNLCDGVESISFLSEQELRSAGVAPALLNDPHYVRAMAVLEGADLFDASFFGFTPREAEIMDPQHRLFLECAWETLENAGYATEQYRGRVGLYAGTSMNTYLLSNLHAAPNLDFMQMAIGNEKDHLATQVSYKLNLKGPSISISTACSTSLVAIHLACQSLLNGECDMSLAGGACIRVPQKVGYPYVEGGVASPDGHCRAFDADAAGTVPGSGVGIVMLKRLEDAIEDGDYIHAVIRGSAINNDGAQKVGYTAPSVIGQAEVIAEAQAIAGVAPETVTYIETHGAGTRLGDPIEMAALTKVFQAKTPKKQFCAVGSVKTNVGHLDTAAGVTGFIKTVLALKHKQLPPSLHFEQPNPEIKFENSPFYVNIMLSDWQANGTPRRAGVSSFGIGGTNAHIILEEAPPAELVEACQPAQLLLISAKTESALQAATTKLAGYLVAHPDLSLADVAYTLQVGRKEFQYRRYLVCNTPDEAANALLTPDRLPIFTASEGQRDRNLVFLFPGQRLQQVNVALGLYQNAKTFRKHIDHCAELLETHVGFDLRTVLYPGEGQEEASLHRLNLSFVAESALFMIEYALAKLWMEWGVKPAAMIGHGLGEYVAACLAGVLSLQNALALVVARGRLLTDLPDASTTFVPDSLLGRFRAVAQRITLSPPQLPYVSNVTGTWMTEQDAVDPDYWVRHLCGADRFAEGVQTLVSKSATIMLEVGPERSLLTLTSKQLGKEDGEHLLLQSLPASGSALADAAFLLETCGRLWSAGISIDWQRFHAGEKRRRVPLPTYAFERERYWIDVSPQYSLNPAHVAREGKVDFSHWFSLPSWKRSTFPAGGNEQQGQRLCWLVFVDECGIGDSIIGRLKDEGQVVVGVRAGNEFSRLGDQTYVLDPRKEDDYDELLSDLRGLNKLPDRIVHLWSVSRQTHKQPNSESFEQIQYTGFYSLLFLVKAFGRQNSTHPVQIRVVSDGVQEIESGETFCPEKATVLGACKVIPQECSNITCQSIDVVLPEVGGWEEERLIEQLMSELYAQPLEPMLAYRGSCRWVQTFEPVRLEQAVGATTLRNAGVYLITGGLGVIGFILAKWLAQSTQARLILTGRTGLPPKEEWQSWLAAHGPSDHISNRIRKVQELEEIGAEVLVIGADVANIEQMRDIVAQSIERFGTIHGVFHAAGIVEEALFFPIHETSRANCELHFQAKVYGLFVLEEVLRKQKLDFCLLLSSLSSILGGLKFVAYASANIFMDAYASKLNREQPVPWISVDWDGRATAEETVKAFQLILSTRMIKQVIASTEDLHSKFRFWINPSLSWETGHAQDNASAPHHPRPELQESYVAPQNEMEEQIAMIWQEVLGIDTIGINDNFFALGGSSLMVIQIIRMMQEAFRVVLSMQLIFENPTIALLAQAVVEKQIEMIGDEQMAELLRRVDQISEEDTLFQLVEKM